MKPQIKPHPFTCRNLSLAVDYRFSGGRTIDAPLRPSQKVSTINTKSFRHQLWILQAHPGAPVIPVRESSQKFTTSKHLPIEDRILCLERTEIDKDCCTISVLVQRNLAGLESTKATPTMVDHCRDRKVLLEAFEQVVFCPDLISLSIL